MKRIFLQMISIFLLVFLFSCDQLTSADVTTETSLTTSSSIPSSTTTTIDPYLDKVVMYDFEDPKFYAEFSNIVITPTTGVVNFTLTSNDTEEGNFYYIIVIISPEHDISATKYLVGDGNFVIDSFFEFYSSGIHQVLIAKSEYYSSDPRKEAVAGFEFECPSYSLRTHLQLASWFFDDVEINGGPGGRENIGAKIRINDPSLTIETLTLLACLKDTLIVADQTTINPSTIRDSRGNLEFHHIFNNLSPNLEYDLYVYANGNDGFSSFSDLFVGMKSKKTRGYISTISSFQGLYATLSFPTFTSTSAEIMLRYINDGTTTIDGNLIPCYIVLYDKDMNLKQKTLLASGDSIITFQYDEIDREDSVYVESEDGSIKLAQVKIQFYNPSFSFLARDVIEGTEVTLSIDNRYKVASIVDATVDILVDNVLIQSVPFEELLVDGSVKVTIPWKASSGLKLRIEGHMTIEYFGNKVGTVEYYKVWN